VSASEETRTYNACATLAAPLDEAQLDAFLPAMATYLKTLTPDVVGGAGPEGVPTIDVFVDELKTGVWSDEHARAFRAWLRARPEIATVGDFHKVA
jgi:hypothetical protein